MSTSGLLAPSIALLDIVCIYKLYEKEKEKRKPGRLAFENLFCPALQM